MLRVGRAHKVLNRCVLWMPGRGSLRPPAASRCCARASLRAPSRGDPPLKYLRSGYVRKSSGWRLAAPSVVGRAPIVVPGHRTADKSSQGNECPRPVVAGQRRTRAAAPRARASRAAVAPRSLGARHRASPGPERHHSRRARSVGAGHQALSRCGSERRRWAPSPGWLLRLGASARGCTRTSRARGRIGALAWPRARLSGGSPREGARSEARAEQRLAAGGRRLPRPGASMHAREDLVGSPNPERRVTPRASLAAPRPGAVSRSAQIFPTLRNVAGAQVSGGSPREGARSEARAQQRLAAGGRRLPRPGASAARSERGPRGLPRPGASIARSARGSRMAPRPGACAARIARGPRRLRPGSADAPPTWLCGPPTTWLCDAPDPYLGRNRTS